MSNPRRCWLPSLTLPLLLLAACERSPDPEHSIDPPTLQDAGRPAWLDTLDQAVTQLDDAMPGDLGVYVLHLGADAGVLDRDHDRAWYLSSTIKVPVAIAILEKVDAGEMDLSDTLELRDSDFVDGSGDLLQQAPGTAIEIGVLLRKSLRNSDSTATDMLIRHLGERELNRRIRAWVGDGFEPITTILQVRYDAYGAAHPGVASLSNRDLLALRAAGSGEARLQALAHRLGVPRERLKASSLQALFEDYYRSGRNSARLDAFARLLEKLALGELLSPASTTLLLQHMQAITTGDRRLSAGLPPGTVFAQKTGTQIARACNLGILNPARAADGATVVVACAAGYRDLAQAEQAFQGLGRALGEAGLAN